MTHEKVVSNMREIDTAIKLREEGKIIEAINILKKLLLRYPNNPDINYQIAWCNDLLENEKEAISYYLSAIRYGLNEKDLKGAYLGLGSTYRAIGKYSESKSILSEALLKFPENNEYRVFLAMTLFNLKEYEESIKNLLLILLETTSDNSILEYKKAILFYSDKLNKRW